mgnify:CR=1 FL=1
MSLRLPSVETPLSPNEGRLARVLRIGSDRRREREAPVISSPEDEALGYMRSSLTHAEHRSLQNEQRIEDLMRKVHHQDNRLLVTGDLTSEEAGLLGSLASTGRFALVKEFSLGDQGLYATESARLVKEITENLKEITDIHLGFAYETPIEVVAVIVDKLQAKESKLTYVSGQRPYFPRGFWSTSGGYEEGAKPPKYKTLLAACSLVAGATGRQITLRGPSTAQKWTPLELPTPPPSYPVWSKAAEYRRRLEGWFDVMLGVIDPEERERILTCRRILGDNDGNRFCEGRAYL